MDISQLLNSDTEPSSSSREPARNPVSYYEETQTHQAVQRRSRFIDLVTAGHLDTDRISPSSGCITVQNDVALSGVNSDVNESDKLSYRATSSYLPHEDLIYSRTTSSPSETSRSPITSTSPSEKVGLVYQLPVGNISLHSRDSSCASRNMAPTRTTRHKRSKKGITCKGSTHRLAHEQLTRRAIAGSESSEELPDYDHSSDEGQVQKSSNINSYKNWNDVPIEFRCTFVEGCILDSPDRKVISHFFGRNKKCTRAIPEDVWAPFCRRHYQRTRYRNVENFGGVQLDLVRRTVENLRSWGGVMHFELILRKRAMQAIRRYKGHEREDNNSHDTIMRSSPMPEKNRCAEAWLVPYLGKEKSFEDILKVVDLIEEHVNDNNCKPPEFEILPSYKPGRMNLPTGKKTLKETSKPKGIRKRSSGRTGSGSQPAAQYRGVATTKSSPATTPKTTPSHTPRTLDTRVSRGDIGRGRPLRTSGIRAPQGLSNSTGRHDTP